MGRGVIFFTRIFKLGNIGDRGVISIYALASRIYKGGNFFFRENHFTEGNRDWFVENNIPSNARDVIFHKPVEIPRGKVIFPEKKITARVNPKKRVRRWFY